MNWEEIAAEYKKEISQLHKDIESALCELEKQMPRSFEKGIGILDSTLDASYKNCTLVKLMEYSIISSKPDKPINLIKKIEIDDDFSKCFEGVL